MVRHTIYHNVSLPSIVLLISASCTYKWPVNGNVIQNVLRYLSMPSVIHLLRINWCFCIKSSCAIYNVASPRIVTEAQFRPNHWYMGHSPCAYFRLFTLSQGEKPILDRSARCAISALFSIMEHKHHTKMCTETLSILISIHFTNI